MKKFIKGFTAYIIMFSVCALMFGIPILADGLDPPPEPPAETPAPTEKRMLYVDFMGTEETPFTEASPQNPNFTLDNVGDKFWIGVAVDKVNDLPLFRNGVYSVEVSFEYDPVFVKPYALSNKPDDEWQTELIKGNLSDENSSLYWNSDQYEIISVRSTEIDVTNDRELKNFAVDRKAAGWEMCTVCITLKENADFSNPRFFNLDSGEKQYLVKFPFILISAPAEGDERQDPPVLSLVRGPETLSIGSDENGVEPFSAWEATITDPDDATNMNTLFSFGGDINLFGEAASMTNIIAKKPISGEETEETEYKLSRTKQLEEEEFDVDIDTYYLSVPNETDKLKLYMETSEPPTTITVNGASINSQSDPSDGSFYVTDVFDLAEINKDIDSGGEADGFNNTVVIESGSSTYTIYIRRLMKPKIVLNPGNSPYGEIERMAAKYLPADQQDEAWDEAKIQKAKEEFNETHKYAANYTPTGLDDRNEITYRAEAWIGPYDQIRDSILPTSEEDAEKIADPTINMDRNETAIFAYQNKKFVDTGFTAINSLGEDVTDQVVRNIEIERLKGYDIDYIPTEDDKASFTFTKDDGYDLSSIAAEIGPGGSADVVRPDIYDLEYTFTDIDGNSVKETRKIIILPELGNVNMKDGVDTNDTIAIYAHDKKAKMIATVEDIKNIYIYRVADTNMKDAVDTNDTIAIYAHDKKAKTIINHYRLTY